MKVRLASNSDGRALALRDHILPVLRRDGAVQLQRDTVRLTELRLDGLAIRHWTPFNELGHDEASSPGYRHAVERQRSRTPLPYGLDVWRGPESMKVLRILWAVDGTVEVPDFVRGPWEDEAFRL